VVGVCRGPKSSGVAEKVEGFPGWSLDCTLGLKKPLGHPLNPSGLDIRAKVQVAVMAASRDSVLSHPAVPPLTALWQSPEELGITWHRPGATSGFGSPYIGLRGLHLVGVYFK
jgi:hypothetical protein